MELALEVVLKLEVQLESTTKSIETEVVQSRYSTKLMLKTESTISVNHYGGAR